MKELKQYLTEDGIKCFKHLAEALSEELKKRAMAYKDDVFPLRLKVFGFKGMQWSNRDEMIGAINMIDALVQSEQSRPQIRKDQPQIKVEEVINVGKH